MKFKSIVLHDDSPFTLKFLLHSKFCHDLVRLHGHPVLDSVDLGVF